LNGLALDRGKVRYVTACSQTDVVDGWREQRHCGGCVVDVASGDIVAQGLSMPHSPRLYRDRLWLVDSGHGHFGYVDLKHGRFEPVAFCPGYARGLCFASDFALVGLSKPRKSTFTGLPLDRRLDEQKASARCGIHVIDLRTGNVVHWLCIEGVVQELYDVIVLAGVVRPKALGFKTEEIRYNVWIDMHGKTSHWAAQQE
jgi:uncharacterized protein (TIGR03032 family)